MFEYNFVIEGEREKMLKKKKIIPLILVGLLTLSFMAGGGKGGAKGKEEAKAPVSEQAVTPLFEKQTSDYITAEEIAQLKERREFSHFDEKDLPYANVLKQSYGKNLLYQTLKTATGEDVMIGALIENKEIPTVLAITRAGCPFCIEMIKSFEDYNEGDFNIIFGEGHVSEKMDVKEDILALQEEAKSFPQSLAQLLVDKSAYNVDPLMDDLFAEYYPTLIYLDQNGFIVNVSKGMDPQGIKTIFENTLAPVEVDE